MAQENVGHGQAAPEQILKAEVEVLGELFHDPEFREANLSTLTREHFTRSVHRDVLEAITVLEERGDPIGPSTISDVWERNGGLTESRGEVLKGMLDVVPGHGAYYLRALREARERRKAHELGKEITLLSGRDGFTPEGLADHLERKARELRSSGGTRRSFPAPRSVAEVLADPEEDEEWIAGGLIPAGGNVLVAGYPKSFKTFTCLELAVAAATSTDFLGRFPVPREHRVGVVLMEGKERRQAHRVERLCMARGLGAPDVEDSIHLWYRPPLMLSRPETVTGLGQWVAELDMDLLIVDAWSYVHNGNSNDADEVTPQLMALSSLRAQCPGLTVLLVHHARKQTGDLNADRLTDHIRNSGAFGAWYDAGLVLFRKDEQSPVKVRSELRDHPGTEPFAFEVDDEEPARRGNDWTAQGALRLTASERTPEAVERDAQAENVARAVLEHVRENSGCGKREIRKAIPRRNPAIDGALDLLEESGEIVCDRDVGPGKAYSYYAVRDPK